MGQEVFGAISPLSLRVCSPRFGHDAAAASLYPCLRHFGSVSAAPLRPELRAAAATVSPQGSFAEYAAVSQDDLCLKPANLSHEARAEKRRSALPALTECKARLRASLSHTPGLTPIASGGRRDPVRRSHGLGGYPPRRPRREGPADARPRRRECRRRGGGAARKGLGARGAHARGTLHAHVHTAVLLLSNLNCGVSGACRRCPDAHKS